MYKYLLVSLLHSLKLTSFIFHLFVWIMLTEFLLEKNILGITLIAILAYGTLRGIFHNYDET